MSAIDIKCPPANKVLWGRKLRPLEQHPFRLWMRYVLSEMGRDYLVMKGCFHYFLSKYVMGINVTIT